MVQERPVNQSKKAEYVGVNKFSVNGKKDYYVRNPRDGHTNKPTEQYLYYRTNT